MRLSFLLHSGLLLFFPAMVAADLGGGCAISIIQPGSAADKAGARLGDILLEGDGKSIRSMSDLHIAVTPVEGKFVMLVQRDDKKTTLEAQVHTIPGQPKLGIKCVPLLNEVSISTVNPSEIADLPNLVQESTPVSVPMNASSMTRLETIPLDCPFPIPTHLKATLTLIDGKSVSGKLISCDPQNVTIRSGLRSTSYSAARVARMELVP